MDSPAFHDVGPVADLEPGHGRQVAAGGTAVAVFRLPGDEPAFVAVQATCPHAGAPLAEGRLRDGQVICAWHGWGFDAASGACKVAAGLPGIRCHDVRVEGGRVLVRAEPR